MSHKNQRDFCKSVRRKYSQYFYRIKVLDVGSLDINGNNKYLFRNAIFPFIKSDYLGIDIVKGKNVHCVTKACDFLLPIVNYYDTIISTEMLEHDKTWKESLIFMYQAVKPGGLLLITCAGDGREEHGTTKHHAWTSPGTNDYYCNISNEMFSNILKPKMFTIYHLEQNNTDLQFYGFKKN